jgi:hypothetical protein
MSGDASNRNRDTSDEEVDRNRKRDTSDDRNHKRNTSDEEDDLVRANKSKQPRGEPCSSLEREEMPLSFFLMQMYFKGNFGNPPRVFTGASKKSGQSSRPLKPGREHYAKVHTWADSWRTDKSRCPFVHCVVRLRSKAQAQYDEFGRRHWVLFIEALARHLQVSQLQAQNKDSDDDSSHEY